jgi:putative glutamine amidotransferase
MPAPLIGITTSRTLNDKGQPMISLMETYVRSVLGVGGLPLLIPLGLPAEFLKQLLDQLDGILFTGGGDIHPEIYGGVQHPRVDTVDEDRDRVELELFKETRRARKPFLGICRGIQLINVASGGTLYEHILDQHPQAIEHYYYPDWPREYLSHTVEVAEGSRLAEALGQTVVEVNSQHHQGIRQLAKDFKATAFAPDGIIEGLELPGYPFGIAVQWHPEWLQHMAPMRGLFNAFVNAARLKHDASGGMDLG